MKQPELGRKILELRKQKGFTQEELVEHCNINVRTIQRIEAGEVMPRSFTLKTILNVLGEDLDNLKSTKAAAGRRTTQRGGPTPDRAAPLRARLVLSTGVGATLECLSGLNPDNVY